MLISCFNKTECLTQKPVLYETLLLGLKHTFKKAVIWLEFFTLEWIKKSKTAFTTVINDQNEISIWKFDAL